MWSSTHPDTIRVLLSRSRTSCAWILYTQCDVPFYIPALEAAMENLLDVQLGLTGTPWHVTNSCPDMSRFMPSLLLLSLLSSSLLLSPPPNSLHLIWFCRRATIYEGGVRYVCLDAHRSYRNVTPVKIPPLLVFHLKVFYYLAVLLEAEPVCKRYYNTSKKWIIIKVTPSKSMQKVLL